MAGAWRRRLDRMGWTMLTGGRDVTCTHGPAHPLHSLHSPRVPGHLPTLSLPHTHLQSISAHSTASAHAVSSRGTHSDTHWWLLRPQPCAAQLREDTQGNPGLPATGQVYQTRSTAGRNLPAMFPPTLLLLDNSTTRPIVTSLSTAASTKA